MNFRFLNIPVHIHPSFLIFVIFFTRIYENPSIEKVILAGILFFSLMVHEYGHALTALYFGARPAVILEAFGGKAVYNSYGITPKQKFLITLNGPLVESLLIVLPYSMLKLGTFDGHPYILYCLHVTMHLNIWWCLLNLIPVAPLDGGQLLRYLLERKFGSKGYKASLVIGLACAVLAAPYLFYLGSMFFGILLVMLGFQHFKALQTLKVSSEGQSPFSAYMKGVGAIENNDLERGKELLKKLLKSKDAKIKHSAIESLAKVYVRENESQKSYDLLLQADPEALKEGKCLLSKLAFERRNYELVAKYSREIYAIEPSYEIAVLNSKAFAYLNQPVLAGGWLDTASQFGEDYRESIKELLGNRAYDAIRDHDAFKGYAEKILL